MQSHKQFKNKKIRGKNHHPDTNQKKASLTVLCQNRLQIRSITQDKEGYFIIIKIEFVKNTNMAILNIIQLITKLQSK